jgi:LPXTG-motif cell wall-anchored protein
MPYPTDCYANVHCVPPTLGLGASHPLVPHAAVAYVPHLASSGFLPYTGADITELAIIGSGAILAGILLLAGRSGRKAGEIQ